MEHVEDNLRIFKDAEPGCMTAEENALIDAVIKAYKARIKTGCTGCEYCMPCPAGVNIPGNLQAWDNSSLYDNPQVLKDRYARLCKEEKDATQCIECGACEEQCPQHIHIIERLKEVTAAAQ